MKHLAALALALLAPTLGCDALVGGACLPGHLEEGGNCIPVPDGSDGPAGGNGGGWQPTTGSSTAGGGQGGEGGSTVGTGGSCQAPLIACPDGCVDLQNDFNNCGACGLHCATEVCVDGSCQGEPLGHTITIGMSYAQSNPSSQRVLGNAVFRSLHNPTRILEYREHALSSTKAHLHAIVASEAKKRNRAYLLDAGSAAALADMMASSYYDVLLIHDQAAAPSGSLSSIAQALSGSIAAFTAGGGTVVVTASDAGANEMCDFLTAAAILSCSALSSAMSSMVYNQVPSDVVGNGVLAPFLAKTDTASFLDAESAGASVTYVFSDDADAPVVIHKVSF